MAHVKWEAIEDVLSQVQANLTNVGRYLAQHIKSLPSGVLDLGDEKWRRSLQALVGLGNDGAVGPQGAEYMVASAERGRGGVKASGGLSRKNVARHRKEGRKDRASLFGNESKRALPRANLRERLTGSSKKG